MSLELHQLDHARCLSLAGELLGGPARAVTLEWELENTLRRRLRLVERRGWDAGDVILQFNTERRGRSLMLGAELYELALGDSAKAHGGAPSIRIVYVNLPRYSAATDEVYQFWAVLAADYRRLYRFLRTTVRDDQRHAPPLMTDADRQRLWQNTIGFLKHDCRRLAEFGVAAKRGALLLGEPGNGKTMACRWLRSQCNRHGFAWRNVTAEQFEARRRDGEAEELFSLDRPGIVFFDDVDLAIRERNPQAQNSEASTFLGGLDGLDIHQGVVYMFTTNATTAQLDPAFLRPGRIDLVLEFKRPDATLRRRLMVEHWHADIIAAMDIDEAVKQTAGITFAELDEVKRLMVLHGLEAGRWDWQRAWNEFQQGRGRVERPPIGFCVPLTTDVLANCHIPLASR
jgi:cell division protease FtsH